MRQRWAWHIGGVVLMIGAAAFALAGDRPGSANRPAPFSLDEPVTYKPTLIEAAALMSRRRTEGHRLTIIDVRTPFVYEMGHIAGAINLPGGELQAHLDTVPQGVTLALYCS
jgi:3-mercaptopyruvate sulfurtransferase SseA